jgi:hypothetical protein
MFLELGLTTILRVASTNNVKKERAPVSFRAIIGGM